MNFRKLTAYEKACVWSEVETSVRAILENCKDTQDNASFFKELDTLNDLKKKLRCHEVALTLERGENAS